MDQLQKILSVLWGTFLMRDIVAKVSPGAALVIATSIALMKAADVNIFDKIASAFPMLEKIPTSISVITALGIFTFFYVVGIMIQTIAFEGLSCLFEYSYWDYIVTEG